MHVAQEKRTHKNINDDEEAGERRREGEERGRRKVRLRSA